MSVHELRDSFKRLEMLAHELRYYENALRIDIEDLYIPFIANLYIEYIFEVFNQNILYQLIDLSIFENKDRILGNV